MVKDIRSGTTSSSTGSGGDGIYFWNAQLAVIGGTLYFFADDGAGGTELFSTDGSTITKVDPSEVDPNYEYADQMAVIGSTLFFAASKSTTGKELFKVESGVITLVKNIRSSSNSSDPGNLTVMNGVLYFTANNGTNGVELWKSDGTDGGTVLVKDIVSGSGGSNPYYLTAVGSTLFFLADDGSNGTELWKSDGTTNGTVIVKDIRAGALTSSPTELVTDGTTLYFRANDGVHGHELWRSDGTTNGTVLVKDLFGADGAPYNLAVADGELYFVGNDGLHGAELWHLPAGEDYKDVYFSASWQAIEERINGEATASTQIVYSIVYVDAQVLRDTFVSGSFSQRLYVQQDANANVTAVLAYDVGEGKWVVVERYLYDPYGNVTVCNADYTIKGDGTPASSTYGWLFYHQGGEYDPATGLYLFRNRHFSPSLMRWVQAEPYRGWYIDGLNLYWFVRNGPVSQSDPTGLAPPTKSWPPGGLVGMTSGGDATYDPVVWIAPNGERFIGTKNSLVLPISDQMQWMMLRSNPNMSMLERIAIEGLALNWAAAQLKPGDKVWMQYFISTQSEILANLAVGKAVCANVDEEKWLLKDVRDFMRPFTQSLYERGMGMPVSDEGWRKFFEMIDRGAFNKPEGVVERFLVAPELRAAKAMAENHINRDLRESLLENGNPSNSLWSNIGIIVDEAQRRVLRNPPMSFGLDWAGKNIDKDLDVGATRDKMRKEVEAQLRAWP